MTSSSDIPNKFEATIEAFTPIVSQPKYNNLQGVCKVLLQTFLLIRLTRSKSVKIASLALPNATYKNQPVVTVSSTRTTTTLN